MSTRRLPLRPAALAGVAVLVAVGGPAVALSTTGSAARSSGSSQDGPAIGVAVRPVSGLYPGASRPLSVTFSNRRSFTLLLRSATVSAKGTPACPAASLTLETRTFQPPLVLRAGGRLTTTVPFGMRGTAPQQCQRTAFTVQVTGRVTRP